MSEGKSKNNIKKGRELSEGEKYIYKNLILTFVLVSNRTRENFLPPICANHIRLLIKLGIFFEAVF